MKKALTIIFISASLAGTFAADSTKAVKSESKPEEITIKTSQAKTTGTIDSKKKSWAMFKDLFL